MSPREWHPDELELELARTGEADERVRLHVEGCADCQREQAALSSMAAELAAPLPAILVPRERDAAIRAAIPTILSPVHPERRRAARRSEGRRRARAGWMLLAPAVAAAAVAAVLLWPRQPSSPVATAPENRADVNADGRIDVRDALALARALDRGGAQAGWDVTGDGLVDRGDVDWIAFAAVSLGGDR